MPSLRRTMSSPSVRSSPAVRSSPYPTSLSSAAANGGPATRPGHGHRRSSGSDTATRRVLADIEWWRVTEGQRDPEAEQDDHDHEQTLQSPAENLLDLWEGLVSPVWPGFLEYPELLAIVPQTPPRRNHRLESTPEASEGPVEGLRRGLQSVDLGPSDAVLPPAATALSRSRSFATASAMPHSDYPNFDSPSPSSLELFN